jgi:hypothetical protein
MIDIQAVLRMATFTGMLNRGQGRNNDVTLKTIEYKAVKKELC